MFSEQTDKDNGVKETGVFDEGLSKGLSNWKAPGPLGCNRTGPVVVQLLLQPGEVGELGGGGMGQSDEGAVGVERCEGVEAECVDDVSVRMGS